MAIRLDQNGIIFSNIDRPATKGNSKYNFKDYIDKNTNSAAGRNTIEILDPTNKFINAIDIDWNGAQWLTTFGI